MTCLCGNNCYVITYHYGNQVWGIAECREEDFIKMTKSIILRLKNTV